MDIYQYTKNPCTDILKFYDMVKINYIFLDTFLFILMVK